MALYRSLWLARFANYEIASMNQVIETRLNVCVSPRPAANDLRSNAFGRVVVAPRMQLGSGWLRKGCGSSGRNRASQCRTELLKVSEVTVHSRSREQRIIKAIQQTA